MLKASVLIRAHDESGTLAACVASARLIAEQIVIVLNRPTQEVERIGKALAGPSVRVVGYPYDLVLDPAKALLLSHDDSSSPVAYMNWCIDKCAHDHIIKADADCVFTPMGAIAIRELGLHPYAGFGGWELTSCSMRTRAWTGEEPRMWDKTIVRAMKHSRTGLDVLWSPTWDRWRGIGWGPYFTTYGPGPFFYHYGVVGGSSWAIGRAEQIAHDQVPFVGRHHALVSLSDVDWKT